MCFNGPKWKREVVPDHKFDFVDTREFHSTSFGIRLRYIWTYILVIKSFLVYVSDIFTAVTMISSSTWSNAIFASCPDTEKDGCVFIPFKIAKWLFVGCILFSFLLLAYETRKAKKIIASRDISYAFTNVMANNYYSLRSYDHFCFFCHINDSTKTIDNFAFFIFFTFKEWKRLLLADGPRQAINALTLYAIYLSKAGSGKHFWDLSQYLSGGFINTALLISITFSVLIFAGSLLLLIIAGVCYVPLLCYIRGNLKEYCCHKVDKRISEVVKRKTKQRLKQQAALARKEAAGDFSHLRNKKGELIATPLPQPTLPNVSLDDEDDMPAQNPGAYPPGQYWQSDAKADYEYYPPANQPDYGEYPPMPMYPFTGQGGYNNYSPSPPPPPHAPEGSIYDDRSSTKTAYAAGQSQQSLTGKNQNLYQYTSNAVQLPDTRESYLTEQSRYASPAPQGGAPAAGAGAGRTSGLAYDDEPAALGYAGYDNTQHQQPYQQHRQQNSQSQLTQSQYSTGSLGNQYSQQQRRSPDESTRNRGYSGRGFGTAM